MTNYARFTIDADPSTNRGYDILNGAAGTLVLETPTSEQWKVTFSVSDATDENAPLASKDAPELTLNNGSGSTGTSVDAATPSSSVTTTWPASGVHSYIIRCTVNNGVDSDGSVNSDYVFERMVSIRTVEGARKIVGTEGTQYSARGWADAQNELVDAFTAAGAWITAGALNQILQYDGAAWDPVNDLTLPSGGNRTISIADVASGTANSLTVQAATSSSGTGGDLNLSSGSGSAGDDDGVISMTVDDVVVAKFGKSTHGASDFYYGFGDKYVERPTVNWAAGDDSKVKELLAALVSVGVIDGELLIS